MANTACCKGCTKKWVTDTTNCHATCPDYNEPARLREALIREKRILEHQELIMFKTTRRKHARRAKPINL